LVSLAASLWSASRRWRTETRNRGVEVTLDYSELRTLGAAEGKTVADVLRRFREAGATSVALDEDTIGGLEGARRIQVLPDPGRSITRLRLGPGLYQRVSAALARKTRYEVQASPAPSGGGDLVISQPYGLVRGVGIGIDRGIADGVRKADLGVIGRVSNYVGVTPEGVAASLDQLRDAGATTVIFSGDDVLGFKGMVRAKKPGDGGISTESVMERDALNYGTVEFGKQKGDAELVRALPERTVRVHTIPGAEMVQADMPGNTQRFLLAARERNIRLLFVRLFLQEPDPLTKNTDYVEGIRKGLERADLVPGRAHGYGELTTPLGAKLLISLGVAAAWLLLADAVTGLFAGRGVGGLGRFLTVGGTVLIALLPLLPGKGTQLAALAAACLFPALGLLHKDALRPDSGTGYSPVRVALQRFVLTTCITGIGIAAIVGLLADRLFLIKADLFLGVKATLVVPVLLVALVYALDLRATEKRRWPDALASVRRMLQRLAAEPVLFWQVAAGLVALIALAFLVMRSGNDPGVGVSGLELKLRSLLDRVMPARPRFKDLLGHPALILALALAARGYRKWALPLLIIGAVGQASLLNTFCHLHTPLPVSLTRGLLGVAFGVIIGLVLYALLDRIVLRRFPAPRAAEFEPLIHAAAVD
jgi:hypothetical protein